MRKTTGGARGATPSVIKKRTLVAGFLMLCAMTPVASANHKTPSDENVIRTSHTNVNVLEEGAMKEKTLDVGVEVYPGSGSGGPYKVDYEIVPITATRGSDFEATIGRGTVTITGRRATIPIKIKGDVFDETNETLRIDLMYARCTGGGTCDLDSDPNQRPGFVTIVDDDGPATPGPDITIINGFVDARTDDECEIEVQLEYGWDENVTINFETEDLEATKGDDYEKTEGTMVMSPGQIRKSIFVPVERDRKVHGGHDRFLLKFSGAKGGHLTEDDGQCTFLDGGRRGRRR